MRLLFALFATVALVNSAQAQQCAQIPSQAEKMAPGIWAYIVPSMPSIRKRIAEPGWRFVRDGATLNVEEVRALVFLGRATKAIPSKPNKEGAVTISLAQGLTNGETPVTRVLLRRPQAKSTCGTRSRIPNLLSFLTDFIKGEGEDVGLYISYHVTNTSNSSVIENFHVNYAPHDRDCVGTDSPDGQRRTAFLEIYDGPPIRAEAELVANVVRGLMSKAVADEKKPDKMPVQPLPNGSRGIVETETKHFKTLASYESQIHTYPLGQRLCVNINYGLWTKGATSMIKAVDLDAAIGPNGRRRLTTTIRWH